jgi:hypothetical protein
MHSTGTRALRFNSAWRTPVTHSIPEEVGMTRRLTPLYVVEMRAAIKRGIEGPLPFVSVQPLGVTRGRVASAFVTCGNLASPSASQGTFATQCVGAPLAWPTWPRRAKW